MTTRPANVTFYLYLGATFSEQTVLKDADGVPYNLTGYSARADIRRDRDDPTPLFTLDTASGGITLGTADGTVKFGVAAAASSNLLLHDPDGEAWVYDLLLMPPLPAGTVDRIMQGRIIALPGVTRS